MRSGKRGGFEQSAFGHVSRDKTRTVIVGAICARGGSRGVPRKNLRPIAGIPLIVRAIRCAQACTALDRIVVSTDDEEIASVARSEGAEVPFLRPAHLALDTSPKWPVFQHLVETLEARDRVPIRAIADLDTGAPLRIPEDVSACLQLLGHGNADVVITASEADRNPYFNMVELDKAGFARVVKQLPAPITDRQSAPVVYSLSPSVFAIAREALDRYDHWSHAKVRLHVIPRERALDIDTETDFRYAEMLLEGQQRQTEAKAAL